MLIVFRFILDGKCFLTLYDSGQALQALKLFKQINPNKKITVGCVSKEDF